MLPILVSQSPNSFIKCLYFAEISWKFYFLIFWTTECSHFKLSKDLPEIIFIIWMIYWEFSVQLFTVFASKLALHHPVPMAPQAVCHTASCKMQLSIYSQQNDNGNFTSKSITFLKEEENEKENTKFHTISIAYMYGLAGALFTVYWLHWFPFSHLSGSFFHSTFFENWISNYLSRCEIFLRKMEICYVFNTERIQFSLAYEAYHFNYIFCTKNFNIFFHFK